MTRILAFATQGAGGPDEDRLRELLAGISADVEPFDRSRKLATFFRIFGRIRHERPDLVAMEGTGVAGGCASILGRILAGVPYVVSSGDAVAPFLSARSRLLGPFAAIYERLLYAFSAGFIGWTPYLVGRALTLGAPRGMTAAGWAPFVRSPEEAARDRTRVRAELAIPDASIVIGIVGSLAWTRRVRYCYGLELLSALQRVSRADVIALVVGDGDGRARLDDFAAGIAERVRFTGGVTRERVAELLSAMDLASLPQSVDRVGSFRYTTKLAEYLAAGLPVVTGTIPLAYDLSGPWLYRLRGKAPWDERYIVELARLLESITREDLAARRAAVPRTLREFDRASQQERVSAFVADVLDNVL